MTRPCRFRVALLLTTIYLMIVVVLLAPLASRSPGLPHVIARECSGECDVCGCSPEQRANQTCCCWRKELCLQHEHKTPDFCKTKQKCTSTILYCGCPRGDKQQEFIVVKIFNDGLVVENYSPVDVVFAERRYSGPLFHQFYDRRVEPPELPPERERRGNIAQICLQIFQS